MKKYSLTTSQKILYNEIKCHPDSTFINISYLRKLDSNINVSRIKESIEEVVSSEIILSTVLVTDENGNVFRDFSGNINVDILQITNQEFSSIKDNLVQPFHLEEPLIRLKLILTETEKYLFFDASRILLNEKGIKYLSARIRNTYAGIKNSRSGFLNSITEMDVPSEEYLREKKYFDELLSENYIGSCPLPDVHTKTTERNKIREKITISNFSLMKIHQTWKISKRAFFTAVLGYVLSEYIAKDSITFVSHYNEGEYYTPEEFVSSQTLFVTSLNTLKSNKVSEFFIDTQKILSESEECQFYTIADVINDYHLTIEVIFDYTDLMTSSLLYGENAIASPIFGKNRYSNCKLLFSIVEISETEFIFTIDYLEDSFSKEFIETFIAAFKNTINEFLTKESLNDISLISLSELKEIVYQSLTQTNFNPNETVVDLFRKQVKNIPDGIAVVFGEKQYTYREINRISDNLAHYLINKGIKKEMFVPLVLKRSELIPICVLGVLKAGAAYQPIDPGYPKTRVSFMLKDVDAEFLIADKDIGDVLEDYNGEIFLADNIWNLPDGNVDSISINPDDAAVIIYTSGSTGNPKGCIIEHKNLSATHENGLSLFNIKQHSHIAAFSNFGFSVSLLDLFTTLCDGGTLYIMDEPERHDLELLEKYLNENEIESIILTTTVGCLVAEYVSCLSLKKLYVAGEKLKSITNNGKYQIINIYGSSETTVSITTYQVTENINPMPVGKPNLNTKVFVLGRNYYPIPIGAIGSCWVTGPQIARGYLNNPETTDMVFFPNIYINDPNYSRIYYTGDLVRLRSDGNFDFIGRDDRQVKIRGFRVELGEIESTVRSYFGISDVYTLAMDLHGEKRIHCFITGEKQIDIEELNKFVCDRLPYYMVPFGYAQLDVLPFNKNGKINKSYLAQIKVISTNLTNPPKTVIQKKIAKILEDVIGTDTFNITDNFFNAGLTSISSMTLLMLLSKEFQVPLQMSDLVENNTIESLERYIISMPSQREYEKYDKYHISKVQKGMLPDLQLPLLLKISSDIDMGRLKQAIVDTVNAHPYILTTFSRDRNGNLVHNRDDSIIFKESEIEMVNVQNIDEVKPSLVKKINLCGGRLFFIKLIRTNDGSYIFLDMHHMISDGKSCLNIFFTDVSKAYLGEILPQEKYSYYDFILQEERDTGSPKYLKAKQYFVDTFTNIKDSLFFSDPNANSTKSCNVVYNRLSSNQIHNKVLKFCTENNLSVSVFYNAVYGYVVSKLKRNEKFVFVSLHDGRYDSRFAESMGCFATRIFLSVDIADCSVIEYIQKMGNQINTMIGYETYSEYEIRDDFNLHVSGISSFLYQGDLYNNLSICGYPAQMEMLENDLVVSNISVLLIYSLYHVEKSGKIYSSCTYDKKRFTEEYISMLVSMVETVAIDFTTKKMLRDIVINQQ